MPAASPTGSDELANNLFTELSGGVDFSLPALDLSDFKAPDGTGNPLHADLSALTLADLTDRTVGGAGIFDGIMEALTKHLDTQYEKNRITGKDYAEVYVQNTGQALSAAVQYALQKDQIYWQTALAQQQAQAAEAQVVLAHLGIEQAKAQAATARIETNTAAANYSLTKLNLSAVDAQRALTLKQTDQVSYQVDSLMPAQLAQVQYETGSVLPAQVSLTGKQEAQIDAEITSMGKKDAHLDYELTNILPKEALRIQSQVDLSASQKAQVDYQTSDILPSEKSKIDADVALSGSEKARVDYQVNSLMPQELELLQEQVEVEHAKISDTRTDDVTPIAGVVAAEKARVEAQTLVINSEKSKLDYEVSAVLPAEVGRITADEARIDALVTQITAEELLTDAKTAQVSYETGNILPAEVAKINAQTTVATAEELRIDAQTANITYETTWIQPANLADIQARTRQTDYNIDNVLPKEVLRIQSIVDTSAAEISRLTAAKDQTLYETANILPSQKANIDADKDVKVYTATSLLPAQVSDLNVETARKTYEKDFILPAQKDNIDEQMESHRAKTLDTRSDGLTGVAGSIGKQKELHQQQIDAYKRDSEAKVAKMILDTWITQKSLDEGLPAPTSLQDANINTVMGHLQSNLNMS